MTIRALTGVACALVCLAAPTAARAAEHPVALIIAQGGLGDESYNDTGFLGFQDALSATGLEGRAIESDDVVAQGEELLRRAADSGFGLIVDLEFFHGEVLESVARDYPEVDFVIFNQERSGANVASVIFDQHVGSYLAGALAAMVTTDPSIPMINEDAIIGVIGGTRSVAVDQFLVGYVQGARAIDPDVEVLIAYSNSFGDPTVGRQIALSMFEQGADIVYQVAGGTGIGVIRAAEEAGRYAIGVDSVQDGLAPGHVLTSMVKRVDLAVAEIVRRYADGAFPGGETVVLGLADRGVGLSDMEYTRGVIPEAYLDRLADIRQEIIDGDRQVWNVVDQGYPDFF
jgi:basic membrane protein A